MSNENLNSQNFKTLIDERETSVKCVCAFCGKEYTAKERYFKPVNRWLLDSSCDCTGYKQDLEKKQEEDFNRELEKIRQIAHYERLNKLAKNSGMGSKFLKRNFNNFKANTKEQKHALATAKRYVETFTERQDAGEGLYIDGGYGVGKTHLASAIAIELIGQGYSVICQTFSRILLKTQDGFSHGKSTLETLEPYISCDLLIIDDLGKEKVTDWSLSVLFNIINERNEDEKPVIVTSNYGFNGLVNALSVKGDVDAIRSIVSRLEESSWQMTMTGDDYRKTALRDRNNYPHERVAE